MEFENNNSRLLPPLAGEAPPGWYGVRTDQGNTTNPKYAVFPIVKYVDGKMHLVGTGFFITTGGIFVTAKHVLMDVFDAKGNQTHPIEIMHFGPGNTAYRRPVLRCAFHPIADVTVGVAANMEHKKDGHLLSNPVLTLTIASPVKDTRVVTFAYPRHTNTIETDSQVVNFEPRYYDGLIREFFPNGRDKVLLPGPCYETSIRIHGGASGGPVFKPEGSVFGVNSTGFDGTDVGYVSSIKSIVQLVVDGVSMEGRPPRSVSILEMARAGSVVFGP